MITALPIHVSRPADAFLTTTTMNFVNRYGLQTEKGTGALIQPILAWGQIMEKGWGIFHEVFDWNVSCELS